MMTQLLNGGSAKMQVLIQICGAHLVSSLLLASSCLPNFSHTSFCKKIMYFPCNLGYSSSSDEPAHFNSSSTATHEVLSGGNFLSFTFQSTIHSLSNETSLSSSLIVVIVILTVVATAITLIGTVCSVTLCIIQRCRQASRNYYRVRAECPSTPMEEQTGQ